MMKQEQHLSDYVFTYPLEVRFRDTDGLGHVNNAVYLTYFEAVRLAYGLYLIKGTRLEDIPFIMGEATVRYVKPVFYGDEIIATARVGRIGTKSFVFEHEIRRGDEVVTTGSTVMIWYDYANQQTLPIPAEFRARVAEVQESSSASRGTSHE